MLKRLLKNTFVRFLFVGALNTLFGFLVYSCVVYLVKNVDVSVVLSNIISIVFNFGTYSKLVFHSTDKSRIYKFFLVYLLVIVLQILSIRFLSYYCGLKNPYIAGGIVILPISTMSYFLMKKFVFAAKTTNVVNN